MKYSLDISHFTEENLSNLSHSIVFFYFPCIIHLRRLSYLSLLFSETLHSVVYIFPFLPCLSLFFFSQLFIKPPQTTNSPSCISFCLGWFWSLPPEQCYKHPSLVLQSLCLPDLIPWISSSPPLYNHKGLYLGHTWWPRDFSFFLQFKPELYNKSSWSERPSASGLVFIDCIEFLCLWLQRT